MIRGVEYWVRDLIDPETREDALLELSKQREKFPALAPYLWHSYGTIACLLQVRSHAPCAALGIPRTEGTDAACARLCRQACDFSCKQSSAQAECVLSLGPQGNARSRACQRTGTRMVARRACNGLWKYILVSVCRRSAAPMLRALPCPRQD